MLALAVHHSLWTDGESLQGVASISELLQLDFHPDCFLDRRHRTRSYVPAALPCSSNSRGPSNYNKAGRSLGSDDVHIRPGRSYFCIGILRGLIINER